MNNSIPFKQWKRIACMSRKKILCTSYNQLSNQFHLVLLWIHWPKNKKSIKDIFCNNNYEPWKQLISRHFRFENRNHLHLYHPKLWLNIL
jgi:hypothetical protein